MTPMQLFEGSRTKQERLGQMTSLRRPEELRVVAHYHRERRDLYWAEIYGSRATSRFRPKGLVRACVLAEARLRRG